MRGGWRSRGRRRRPDDGRFLPKDAKAWRTLITRARAAARSPQTFAAGERLARAGEACSRAVPPPGHATRDSIFLRLALEARLFWTLLAEPRGLKAPVLAELAAACEAALDAPPPAARPRADIDG